MMTLLGIQSHAGMLVYCSMQIRKSLVSAPYHPLRSGAANRARRAIECYIGTARSNDAEQVVLRSPGRQGATVYRGRAIVRRKPDQRGRATPIPTCRSRRVGGERPGERPWD